MQELNSTLLGKQQAKEEITREIIKYFEMNENKKKTKTHQQLQDEGKFKQ